MKEKRKLRKHVTVTILVAVILFLSLSLVYSNFCVKTVDYTFDEPTVSDEIRIVFLSDLHGRSLGKDNGRILSAIIKASPDIICLVGDFFDTTLVDDQVESMYRFCRDCAKIADTYFSLGNHERLYMAEHGDIGNAISDCGVTLLEEEYVDLNVRGQGLRLGGMSAYAFPQDGHGAEWHDTHTYNFLTEFTQEQTKPTIMLSHRPESFFLNNVKHVWSIGYVLSGHTHGGLWRLPFIGGLLAPEQLWFPEYDYGDFDYGNLHLLITAGFQGYGFVPRLFNPCEIAVLHLT